MARSLKDTLFNYATEWLTARGPINQSSGSSLTFEQFWALRETEWHQSPTRFCKGPLGEFQEHKRLDRDVLYNDEDYVSGFETAENGGGSRDEESESRDEDNGSESRDEESGSGSREKRRKVRFVCTSDTHNQTHRFKYHLPDGDVLVHAGDFSQVGADKEIYHFVDWLDSLPHPIKIVIAGNHEVSFDPTTSEAADAAATRVKLVDRLKQSCTYLEDSSATVHGIKIFGSPWQPGSQSRWGYNLKRGDECAAKWREIPEDTDILVTHGPPAGHGDICRGGDRAGCVDMLQEIQLRVKPKYHIFGHIHEARGITTDGQTVYINASMCDIRYSPEQHPIVFDMESVSEETVLESAPSQWTLSDPRERAI